MPALPPSPETGALLPAALLDHLAGLIAPDLNDQTALVGMHTGGVWVMHGLIERLRQRGLVEPPSGEINTAFYRDDYARRGLHENVKASSLPFEVEGRHILLIDDILRTGRSVRAAINLLFDYGRPASVRLAILVDRGGRELPIQADYVGARIELPAASRISLRPDAAGVLRLEISGVAA